MAGTTPAAIASDEDKSSSVAEEEGTRVLAGRPKPETKERPLAAVADRAVLTEARRLKGMTGRRRHMTGLACRQDGHLAKDWSTLRPDADRKGSMITTTKNERTANRRVEAVISLISFQLASFRHFKVLLR